MSESRTTELLREGLTEHGIEWRSGLEGVTFVGDWCLVEYDNGKLAATCEPVLTPEQAIAATMGEKPRDRTEEWLLKACNRATQDYVAQLEREVDELKGKLEAATLGSERHAYEQRIVGDGSNWGEIMRDAYDELMASANESCTPGEIADLEAHIAATLGNRTC